MSISQQTRQTLLRRAFDVGDQEAWAEFVAHYRKFIFYVLNGLSVSIDDAEDISQKVLIALTRDLPNYDSSKSRFRTWLSSMIRNIAVTHLRQKKSEQNRVEKLGESTAIENFWYSSGVDEFIEKEWATYIASQAMERVRKGFKGQAVEAFELTLDGNSAEEVAELTGLTVSSVYTLCKRVKKRLYLEIMELTSNLEP